MNSLGNAPLICRLPTTIIKATQGVSLPSAHRERPHRSFSDLPEPNVAALRWNGWLALPTHWRAIFRVPTLALTLPLLRLVLE